MTFPNIDPIALQLGPIAIHWYALAYIAGIILGYYYVGYLNNKQAKPPFSEKAKDDLIFYAVLGVLLGGRIGYILFYNLPHFLDHPAEALKIWQGGMSFHGGLLGIFAAFWLYARKYGMSWYRVMDYLACATPIGLFFGRLANFINGELYGRVTDSPLGMVFPRGGPEPRYPSQLFEAALEGIVLFIVLFIAANFTNALKRERMCGGIFILGYALCRFTIEFFRQPDEQIGFLALGLTMGQMLCLPMMALGLWGIITAKKPS